MFGIEAVAIVTLNALTIIVYLKERSLRKRSMYLVINQAFADMFTGASILIYLSGFGHTFENVDDQSSAYTRVNLRIWRSYGLSRP